MATNLAVGLARELGEEEVVLVDADLQFGDVALMLRLDPSSTIIEVARGIETLSDADLDAVLLRHDSGLRVLPAPATPVADGERLAAAVVRVVDRLRSLHRFVIVDRHVMVRH